MKDRNIFTKLSSRQFLDRNTDLTSGGHFSLDIKPGMLRPIPKFRSMSYL